MSKTTLRPCPFCFAVAIDHDPMLIVHKRFCFIGEITCIYKHDKKAVSAWNILAKPKAQGIKKKAVK